ncbi:MAG: DUF1292 domain-containing protein [Ruminococcus sp.]|nr:DUF1292 domain-containing protein [Ruminococcus sp.]
MSDNDIKNPNDLPDDDLEKDNNEDYVTLIDDNGEEVSFEILSVVDYSDRRFAVMLPFDEDDDGVVILELVESDDPDYEDFVSVEDEKLLLDVYEEFKRTYSGEYSFE